MLIRLHSFSFWKEISFVFLIKIAALYTLWYFCFSPSHKQQVNTEKMAKHLLLPAHTVNSYSQEEDLTNARKY